MSKPIPCPPEAIADLRRLPADLLRRLWSIYCAGRVTTRVGWPKGKPRGPRGKAVRLGDRCPGCGAELHWGASRRGVCTECGQAVWLAAR